MPENDEYNNELTTFGRYAVNAFQKHKYIGALLTGPFGIGKSCSALQIGREIIQYIYNVDEHTAYKMILDKYLVFDMEDVI